MNTLYKNARRYLNRLKRKLNQRDIETRLLVLVLTAGILSFLTLGGLSFYAMSIVRDGMNELGERIGRAGAHFTENLMNYQFELTLGELAKSRADFIDHETVLICQDVEILANMMTNILVHPENYRPVKVLDPRFDAVKNFDPYILYSPEFYRDGMTPENLPTEIQNEIALAGNIRTLLVPLSKTFADYRSSLCIGSKNGWYIGVTVLPDNKGTLAFTNEEIQFDCRERPWYKSAINAKGTVFSGVYSNTSDGEFQVVGYFAPFYDNQGAAGVVGLDFSNTDIYKMIGETSIGKNGFNFVLGQNGEIIFSSRTKGELVVTTDDKDLRDSAEKTLADAAKKMLNGENGIVPVIVDGEEYLLAFAPIKSVGWSFGTLVLRKNIATVSETSREYFSSQVEFFNSHLQGEYFLLTFAALILMACLLSSLYSLSKDLSAFFVRPIHRLADGVRDIIKDQSFDKKIDINTGDEIEDLANSFNDMTSKLKAYMANWTKVTAEKERIATELDVAKEIQNGMLPADFPTRKDFELFATMTPAKQVGGDFYDFYFLDETHVAITVADVSGKGIPAALFMVIAKTVLNNFALSSYKINGLAAVVEAANEKLCANNDATMFVTAFIGVLDLESGEFTFVNAGHNPPVIYHAAENRCDFLNVKKNFVMGAMDGVSFAEQKINFNAGDLIFIYTDGVTEAMNVNNEEYLPDRLIKFMNSTDCRADLNSLLKAVSADVAAHVGDAEQSDDITMFALRFNGSREDEV